MESQKVSKRRASQTVLIVDEDLGFLFWLGELLVEAGCQAVPAFGCLEAVSRIRQFNVKKLDAIFVNPALPGTSDMLHALGRTHGGLRIILIGSSGIDVSGMMPAHAMLEKPRSWQRISRQEWQRKVKQALNDAPPFVFKATTS